MEFTLKYPEMKKIFIIALSFFMFACSNESADDDNPENNISELIGIYEVVWIDNEDNTIDFCPGTEEFKSDNTVESVFDDDDDDDICGNEDVRVLRTYEITLDGSNVIRGNIGTGQGGVLSGTINGVDIMGSIGEDSYAITFEYNKNTEELIYNLYLDADDIVVYMLQKL